MYEIKFHRVSFDVTFRCTLKCKLCCSYSPYFEPIPHYTYEQLSEGISRFFDLVDYVDIFGFGGGEPLLHKDLDRLFIFVNKYRDRIGRLEVITNGTIVPSKSLVEIINAAKAKVLLDDYGPDLSLRVDEAEAILRSNNTFYERRYNNGTENGAYCDGWVDLLTMNDLPHTPETAKANFSKCLQAHELRCNPVINGIIYPCPTVEFYLRNKIIKHKENNCFDLFDDTLSRSEKREIIKEYMNIDMLMACAYCKGFFTDSKRYVPARQLTKDEMISQKKLIAKTASDIKEE